MASNSPNTAPNLDPFANGIQRGTEHIVNSIYQLANAIHSSAHHQGATPEVMLDELEGQILYALDTARRFHTNPPLEGEAELVAEGIIPPAS
jgi:hypothetical protein